ncbi:MAG: hypothetical protein S4CHLAM2_04240 [Chlamydiales bacterium]|nr:hypothetical protein [Chlamydiales bacterium]
MLRFFLFVFFLCTPCWGSPSKPLLEVLDRFGIVHDGSWESIQEETEKAWLKGRHVELWEIEPIQAPSDEETYALFTPLGMTQTIHASECTYTYALLLGATQKIVRKRLLFLKNEWDRGVRFEELVILTGDRPLTEFETSQAKNETEMIKELLQEMDLPQEWHTNLTIVDTPRPEGMRRPHTYHTIEYWLATEPPPGTMLVISDQPFVYRQGAVFDLYIPGTEPIGEGFTAESIQGRAQILLAELAQWIKLDRQAASGSGNSSRSRSPCLYER